MGIDFMEEITEEITFLPETRPAAETTETEKALASFARQRKQETEAEKAARAAKRAARLEKGRERVEAYDFTDTVIKGKTWYILFDGAEQKTRVIFEKRPAEKVREAVKAAGFWYNGPMKSWNRKLNRKSYRAACELAIILSAYTA